MQKIFFPIFIALLGGLIFSPSVQAKSTRFEVRDAVQRNLLSFVSEAPLARVVGVNPVISGWLEVDPEKIDSLRGEFEMDMRSFQTGIEVRNEFIREKLLNTAEFTSASYAISGVSGPAKSGLRDQQPASVKVEGVLKLKGVAHSFGGLAKLTYFKANEETRQRLPGNLLRISSTFDLDINQFNMVVPENLKLLFARYLQISLDVVGSDAALPLAIPIIDAPKLKEKK